METTGERDSFGIHTFDYYRKAWEIFVPREQARLFLAYADNELLAGIFVTRLGNEAIYLYGASSNVAAQSYAQLSLTMGGHPLVPPGRGASVRFLGYSSNR